MAQGRETSRGAHVWKTTSVDQASVTHLAHQTGLPLPLLGVLIARGIDTPERIDRFLKPRLSDLSDPFAMPGVGAAVERIWRAILKGESIAVYGDYDVDGVTGAALLALVLKRLGAHVRPFLPSRIEEGYGLSVEALARCLNATSPDLVLTVDCGSGSHDAVAAARQRGVDVVVTDHHEVCGPPASAVAVVNPKLGANDETRMLAGVGVAFKMCHALVKYGRDHNVKQGGHIDLRPFLDLVALGTIADVVPLLGENRILANHGLACLNRRERLGLSALMEAARASGELSAYHVGYVLGPRLNAAGRLGNAEAALELLVTEDVARARALATALDAANRERKRIETEILEEAVRRLDAAFDPSRHFSVVVAENGWHVGVIGIVATRLAARYNRPAVVVGFDEQGMGRGSCRSIEGFDLAAGLNACSKFLSRFGGHAMAAGLELSRLHLRPFQAAFEKACAAALRDKDLRLSQRIDAWLTPREALDPDFFSAVARLQPFGEGNREPVWGLRGARLVGSPRVLKDEHLKMVIGAEGWQCEAIGFGMGRRRIPEGPLDLAFTLRQNSYLGRESIQFHIVDFRKSSRQGLPDEVDVRRR